MKEGFALRVLDLLRTTNKTSVGLVAILALTFYLRLLYFGQIIDADVGNLGYLGWRMAEGEILLDFEGPGKPPLYPMLYALFVHLFGPSPLGLKMFGTIFILMAVLAVYWLAKQAYGEQVGLLAAFLFGIFSSGPIIEGGTVNMETVLHLPYILAVGLFIKASMSGQLRWYFLTGICAALGTLVKQVGGVVFFVFLSHGIYEWLRKPIPSSINAWLCRYILLCVGAVLPVMGVIIFYQFHGYTLGQLYDSMLGNNLRYIQRGYEYTNVLYNFILSLKIILPENGLLWLSTMFAGISIGMKIWRGKGEAKDHILLFWGIWSFAVLWVSSTFYWHYFLQLISPFSVLGAYGMIAFWRWVKSLPTLSRWVGQGVGSVLLTIMVVFLVKTDYKYFFSYTPMEQTAFQYKALDGRFLEWGLFNVVQREIASYIRSHTDPAETIYVWGIAPQVYFLAQRRAATRYRTNYNLSSVFTRDPFKELNTYAPTVMEEMKKSPPAFIIQIFALEDFSALQAFVRDRYEIDKGIVIDTPPFRINVYQRRP